MGQRILVIEDSAVIRRLIEVCLRAADLEILMREDGPGGLEAVRTELPDLLILDIGLPGMDGWQVLDYIRSHVPSPKTAPLCGNSIATDRGFLARDMPELDDFLHYRMIDVSSIKELCRRWYPRIYYGQPEKGLAHRALADIQESIRELRYYRRTAFVPLPGPSTSEIAEAVAELADGPENDSDAEADNG